MTRVFNCSNLIFPILGPGTGGVSRNRSPSSAPRAGAGPSPTAEAGYVPITASAAAPAALTSRKGELISTVLSHGLPSCRDMIPVLTFLCTNALPLSVRFVHKLPQNCASTLSYKCCVFQPNANF